jgi:hypothetical protein
MRAAAATERRQRQDAAVAQTRRALEAGLEEDIVEAKPGGQPCRAAGAGALLAPIPWGARACLSHAARGCGRRRMQLGCARASTR